MEPTALDINSPLFRALILVSLVTIPFKALALWKAARSDSKGWFVALLLINTLGVLDIIYYFFLSQPDHKTKNKNSSK